MDVSCDLEVDVNGEETFMVDKRLISSYSGRISKLFGKSTVGAKNLKLIFHDFPGGAESFELMARFCYNKGKFQITPLNLPLLHCTADFMEMNKPVSGTLNLLEKTHKSLEEIKYWTWSELLGALKQCQSLLPISNSSGVLHKCLDSLMGRLAVASSTSPCPSTSSPDSSTVRFSCDTRSTESLKSSSFKATWWFEDLVGLNPRLVEMVTKFMVSHEFDHSVISKFLFYYHKSKSALAKPDEKRKITEAVVDALHSLDRTAVPCKSLFGILTVSQSLKISKCCKNKLETMIGSQIDHATLDNLLVPSPSGRSCLYDVDLVLRLLKSFLGKGKYSIQLVQLKKVTSLVDSYVAEVAPDPSLKPAKFLALIRSLPDYARDSYDGVYSAMDMYLEAHAGLSEDDKISVCCGLNYEKLSSETCKNLAQNKKFPSKSAVQALFSQQCKLKSLLHETNLTKRFLDSPCSFTDTDSERKRDEAASKQIVLYAGKPDLSAENEKLRENLQGMQWRVMELEKVCKKMQTQMTKMMKSRLSSQTSSRSLPRMCS